MQQNSRQKAINNKSQPQSIHLIYLPKISRAAIFSALCALLAALIMAKPALGEQFTTTSTEVASQTHTPFRLHCPAPDRDVIPGVFTIMFKPGYTIEQHAAVIFESTNEDIQRYIHHNLSFPDSTAYFGKHLYSPLLLHAIRSDPGVESVECDRRVKILGRYAPLRNCPLLPPRPSSFNSYYLVYLEANYSLEEHAERFKVDIFPRIVDMMALRVSCPDKIVYLGKDIDEYLLNKIRADRRVEEVYCDGGLRRSGLSSRHDQFPDRSHMNVNWSPHLRLVDKDTWENFGGESMRI
ncbi:uncharacterized protein LY89DRAFT_685428 [Mollisia scopiformis]|uniref:Uncharacterized protein n=1 Tax=Mollisia scopiformis TaxID=149040 RepID=A0A194X8M8_MOLSC|nr:uncharacterized protein LY89DRAFT_685428 [Mollisia scopiformis]KUJ16469.1 hypothetical protein LY89DRAFT_685428 [Mollisia scopiformis]